MCRLTNRVHPSSRMRITEAAIFENFLLLTNFLFLGVRVTLKCSILRLCCNGTSIVYRGQIREFRSIVGCQITINEKQNYVVLVFRDTKTLESGKSNAPKRVAEANPALNYYDAKLCCSFGGKKFQRGAVINGAQSKYIKNWAYVNPTHHHSHYQ
jgi:hypothetical protein